MARPKDIYTHSHFRLDPTNRRLAVCIHCNTAKVIATRLHDKRSHLTTECPEYKAWREAGYGEPIDQYPMSEDNAKSKNRKEKPSRGSSTKLRGFEDNYQPQREAVSDRKQNEDPVDGLVQDPDHLPSMTIKVRRVSQQDEQPARANDRLFRVSSPSIDRTRLPVLKQDQPSRKSPSKRTIETVDPEDQSLPARAPKRSQSSLSAQVPISLTNRLYRLHGQDFKKVTQMRARGAEGTASSQDVLAWLAHAHHQSRAMLNLVGILFSKVKYPKLDDSIDDNVDFKVMDLLTYLAQFMKGSLTDLHETARHGKLSDSAVKLQSSTKSLLDCFAGATLPDASLLEGMVIVWAAAYVSIYTSLWAT